MASINKVIGGDTARYILKKYVEELNSISMISEETGIAKSTIRFFLKRTNSLRTREESIKLASKQGRIGAAIKGRSRVFTPEHCQHISEARLRMDAKGISKKPSGYLEYSRGPHKFKSVHRVAMEEALGFNLPKNFHVHHIDGNKLNNDINNLAVMTRSAHSRLHAQARSKKE